MPLPDFDTRTLTEIKNGVARKANRYYTEQRPLEELEEVFVNFDDAEAADGNNADFN